MSFPMPSVYWSLITCNYFIFDLQWLTEVLSFWVDIPHVPFSTTPSWVICDEACEVCGWGLSLACQNESCVMMSPVWSWHQVQSRVVILISCWPTRTTPPRQRNRSVTFSKVCHLNLHTASHTTLICLFNFPRVTFLKIFPNWLYCIYPVCVYYQSDLA